MKPSDFTATINKDGSVAIPARFRRAMGIRPADQVVLCLENGDVRITSRAQARRRAQEYVVSLLPKNVSLVDETDSRETRTMISWMKPW